MIAFKTKHLVFKEGKHDWVVLKKIGCTFLLSKDTNLLSFLKLSILVTIAKCLCRVIKGCSPGTSINSAFAASL